MLLSNARWLDKSGTWQVGSISIFEGRIQRLSPNLKPQTNDLELDCSEYTIFPGAIDPHVHFREPGVVAKEGIVNGCHAALGGGVTTIFDMPNTIPPCCSRVEFDSKRKLFAEKAPVNWGLFFDVSLLGNSGEWTRQERPAGKLYMAKSSPARPVRDVPSVAKIFSDYFLISIHAEDENFLVAGEKVHHIARPRESVVAALHTIEQAWELANPKPRLVLCHIGTKEEIEWIKKMRAKGANVAAETCAHYLLLTQDDYLSMGNIYKVNPPIREASDRTALIEALHDGTVDFIATDHAPHLPSEKASETPPSGIAGIEWYYPLVLHIAQQVKLPWERVHSLVCGGAASTFNLPERSGIVEGNFADLVLIKEASCHQNEVITKAGTRPFAQFPLAHEVRHVFVNGNWVYKNRNFNPGTIGHEVLKAF